MHGDKPAIEQLTIETSGTNPGWSAKLDGKEFAKFSGCPGGIAVRWLWLDWPEPHWNTVHADFDTAVEYIRLWVTGLDIVPWDDSVP